MSFFLTNTLHSSLQCLGGNISGVFRNQQGRATNGCAGTSRWAGPASCSSIVVLDQRAVVTVHGILSIHTIVAIASIQIIASVDPSLMCGILQPLSFSRGTDCWTQTLYALARAAAAGAFKSMD